MKHSAACLPYSSSVSPGTVSTHLVLVNTTVVCKVVTTHLASIVLHSLSPSHSCHKEEDRQRPTERVGLFHPGGADQGLHGRKPESAQGERRPVLSEGHDAQARLTAWQESGFYPCYFRDQELVCRENERLLKKLEDVNS